MSENKIESFIIYKKVNRNIKPSDWHKNFIKIFSVVEYDFNKKLWNFFDCKNYYGERTLKTSIKNNMLINYLTLISNNDVEYTIQFLPDMFMNNRRYTYNSYDLNNENLSKIKTCINLILQMPRQ
jgi:hypothetical protein